MNALEEARAIIAERCAEGEKEGYVPADLHTDLLALALVEYVERAATALERMAADVYTLRELSILRDG